MREFEDFVDKSKGIEKIDKVEKHIYVAKSKQKLKKCYGFNGEFLKVTDITKTINFEDMCNRLSEFLEESDKFSLAEKRYISEVVDCATKMDFETSMSKLQKKVEDGAFSPSEE